jgi:hypothetical protein
VTRKNSRKGLCRRPNRCAVLHGQMAKVESPKHVLKTVQAVEKVVVGPAGGPIEARNKAKTLQKRRFQPLVQRLKRALRSFSTRWVVFDTIVLTSATRGRMSEVVQRMDPG